MWIRGRAGSREAGRVCICVRMIEWDGCARPNERCVKKRETEWKDIVLAVAAAMQRQSCEGRKKKKKKKKEGKKASVSEKKRRKKNPRE